nr:competence type IV pilus minor pilin ComGE [Bacillus sp. FJAT-47783]
MKRIKLFLRLEKGDFVWRNCKGTSFVETIVAFSIWCFITMTIIPLLTSIFMNEQQTNIKVEAHRLLTEELAKYAHENVQTSGKVERGQYTYVLQWTKEGEFDQLCIELEEAKGKKICGYAYKP